MINDLRQIVIELLKFPRPKICRHLAALDILSVLHKNGIQLPDGLICAVSKSSEGDEEALRIIHEWSG